MKCWRISCTLVGFHREIRPRYMKCVSISSSKDIGSPSHRSFTRAFRALYFSVTAYSLYQIKFRLSRTFFDLFSRFSISSRRFRNFFWPPLLRSSLFSISNRNPFVKNFFISFSTMLSGRPPSRDSLIIIRSHFPFVNSFFFFFRSFPPYPYPSFEPCRFTWYNVLKSHAHT